jgi:hypothetical protein
MAPPERDERTLRRYLLRTLPEEQRLRVERGVLGEDGLFDDLSALEDDLFHDYAAGRLSDSERADFERSLMTLPGADERLAAARALLARVAPAAAPRVRPGAWLAAAAALILALGVLWLLRGQREAAPRPQQAVATPSPAPAAPSLASPTPAPSPGLAGRVLALALSPAALRSGGAMPKVTIAPDVTGLRLQLQLPAGAGSGPFQAVIRSAEGQKAWSGRATTHGRTATVEPMLAALPEGDYELVLLRAPSDEIATYRFRLLRE